MPNLQEGTNNEETIRDSVSQSLLSFSSLNNSQSVMFFKGVWWFAVGDGLSPERPSSPLVNTRI